MSVADDFIETPLPAAEIDEQQEIIQEPSRLATAFVHVFGARGVTLEDEASIILVSELLTNSGTLNETLLDLFYQVVSNERLTNLNAEVTSEILADIRAADSERPVVPVGRVSLEPHPHKQFRAAALREALEARFKCAIQRIGESSSFEWWTSGTTFNDGSRVTVQPVHSSIGLRGQQAVLGWLVRDGDRWLLRDTTQEIRLDFSKWRNDECTWALEGNLLIVTGSITGGELEVTKIEHPPRRRNIGDDEEESEALARSALLGCRAIGSSGAPDVRWAFAGPADCRKENVRQSIGSIISSNRVTGLVLFGPFAGAGATYNDVKKALIYLKDLRRAPGFQIILVPSVDDPGPRYYPKMSLLPDCCAGVVCAGNPAKLICRQMLPGGGRLKTEVIAMHSTLTKEAKQASLIPGREISTAEETAEFISTVTLGQAHLLPLALGGRPLHIAAEMDADTMALEKRVQAIVISGVPKFLAAPTNAAEPLFVSPGNLENKQWIELSFLTGEIQQN